MLAGLAFSFSALALPVRGDDAGGPSTAESSADSAAARGYRFMTSKVYVPVTYDQEVFDDLWHLWEEPLRSRAAKASLEEQRRMAFSRYGLTEAPGNEIPQSESHTNESPEGERHGSQGPVPMQYVSDGQGGWAINCLSCHGGKVLGRPLPGLPNSHFAMQTFTDEVRSIKVWQRKIDPLEVASATFPMGGSNGTTNAVMFGVALGSLRDADLNVRPPDGTPAFVHHDMDAPPWWNVKKKTYLYADGFVPKSPRALMQFLMVPQNDGAKFREWESDFEDIFAWIESLEPPQYPFPIDRELAAAGRHLFENNCSRCHGTYGERETYPNKVVPIAEVATDRARLDSLTPAHRRGYAESWFGARDTLPVVENPDGYVAPPLDGIWASAPYLHNGSVPTLWHLFHESARPVVWRRTEDGYDTAKVGLEIQSFDELPADVTSGKAKRRYFDTRLFGKSATGHTFPEELTEPEKDAVIEYLKTL